MVPGRGVGRKKGLEILKRSGCPLYLSGGTNVRGSPRTRDIRSPEREKYAHRKYEMAIALITITFLFSRTLIPGGGRPGESRRQKIRDFPVRAHL
jgi:hypothetical protein